MKTTEQPSQPIVKDAIRRALGFKALRSMRNMVDEIEREDITDKKLLRALLITLPLILVLVAILIYFYSTTTIIQPIT